MELKHLIAEYLEQAHFLQVATAKDNQPWTCTVHLASDDKFNFYWVSLPTTRHSQELVANSKVAGTIVLPQGPDDKVRGLQYQGVAEELSGEAARPALEIYAKRYEIGTDWVEKVIRGEDEHKCYRITPSVIVLFDQVNFPDDPRQEYKVGA